jgi:hypothetical protein
MASQSLEGSTRKFGTAGLGIAERMGHGVLVDVAETDGIDASMPILPGLDQRANRSYGRFSRGRYGNTT